MFEWVRDADQEYNKNGEVRGEGEEVVEVEEGEG